MVLDSDCETMEGRNLAVPKDWGMMDDSDGRFVGGPSPTDTG